MEIDLDFWRQAWVEGRTAFDQPRPNDLLVEHLPALGLAPGSRVLVPLCGRSVDLDHLLAAGHEVVGTELSEIAVDSFFASRGLEPRVEQVGERQVYAAPGITIYQGDHFELTPHDVEGVAAVYDRASLVALPETLRDRYAEHLRSVLPAPVPMLVITFEYDEGSFEGPPLSVPAEEVERLFGATHDVDVLERVDLAARGGSSRLVEAGVRGVEEVATALRPRGA